MHQEFLEKYRKETQNPNMRKRSSSVPVESLQGKLVTFNDHMVAEWLTRKDFELFHSMLFQFYSVPSSFSAEIRLGEFLHQSWFHDKAPNITKFVERFNDVRLFPFIIYCLFFSHYLDYCLGDDRNLETIER
jgi:hypothetical protein